MDGLGYNALQDDWTALLEEAGHTTVELAAWRDDSYFDTQEPAGPLRAAKILEESAFYTRRNYKASALILRWCVAGLMTLLILYFLAVSDAPHTLGLDTVPLLNALLARMQHSEWRIFYALASSFVFFEIGLRMFSFGSAERELDGVWCRLEQFLQTARACQRPVEHAELMILSIIQDYNSVVERAPMILKSANRWQSSKTVALWKIRRGLRTA